MTASDLLSQLHDAVLRSIQLDWEHGRVRLELSLVRRANGTPRYATLQVEGLRRLDCPREEPWGKSESILSARLVPATESRSLVELEMQSGDTLHIEGTLVTVVKEPDAPELPPVSGQT